MRKLLFSFLFRAAIPCFGVACFYTSCKPLQPLVCNDPATCFKINKFSPEIKKRIDGKSIGYGYVIGYKNDLVAFETGGMERLPQDPPAKPFSVTDHMNVASLSKTITAIAAMKILHDNKIDVRSFIAEYLPTDWKLGEDIKTITFHELLTHTSGLREPQWWMDYDAIRQMVNGGITMSNKFYKYVNSNYRLLAILIARISGINITGSGTTVGLAYAGTYEDYVNKNIFSKLGIPALRCKPDAKNQNLSYQFPDNGKPGNDFGDFTQFNGQAGWNISLIQYATVIRSLFYSTKLVPTAVSDSMKANMYGFDPDNVQQTPIMKMGYIRKNGGFPSIVKINQGAFNGEVFIFNNDVTAALVTNSDMTYPGGIRQLIIDAFDASK